MLSAHDCDRHPILQLTALVSRRVLTPVQAAYLEVAAHPASAHVPAFAEALAAAAAESPAAELMAAGEPSLSILLDAC